MIEHTLPSLVRRLVPPVGYGLAGLTCTGYGSIANRRAGGERLELEGYAVAYVQAGSCLFETPATPSPIEVAAGDLFWLFPSTAYVCIPCSEGCSVQWATFTGPLADSFEMLGWLARARPVVHPEDTAQIDALFRQLCADLTSGDPLAGLLGAAVIYRLAVVAHGTTGATESDPPREASALPQAIALIQTSALQPLDLHAVADQYGIGYSTLRRRFKQTTGQSVTEYLARIRLHQAKQLLTHTRMSVAEVADAVGFADPYYFSRVFRFKEGLTPTAFRAREQCGRI